MEDILWGVFGMLLILLAIAVAIGLIGLAILPTIIAFKNKSPNKWLILALNIVAGGTIIGWVAALIWAVSEKNNNNTVENIFNKLK